MSQSFNLETCTSLIEALDRRHATWCRKTFGVQNDPQGPANQLLKEAKELVATPRDVAECADILLLLLSTNRAAGRTVKDLLRASHEKMSINEMRQWSLPGEDGSVEHVRENPIDSVVQQMNKSLS